MTDPKSPDEYTEKEHEIVFDAIYDVADRYDLMPTDAEVFLERADYFEAHGL
jgi:hypothetical protein